MKGFIFFVVFFGIILTGILVSYCSSPTVEQPIEKIVYVPVEDSVAIGENVALREMLRRTQDSLNAFKHTMSSDEFIARYKLERIRYYTNIVDNNPKQMKYYKGWIKRVLE